MVSDSVLCRDDGDSEGIMATRGRGRGKEDTYNDPQCRVIADMSINSVALHHS